MESSDSSCAKRARQLSLNQIREIVMDSDSDEEQYDISGMEDEEIEPCPPEPYARLMFLVCRYQNQFVCILTPWPTFPQGCLTRFAQVF